MTDQQQATGAQDTIGTDDILIRDSLKPGDIGSIVLLHGQLYAREHNYDHTFEAYVAEPLSQCVLRNSHREKIWVVEMRTEADADKRVLGSIAICQHSDATAQLRWFILSPELRGTGTSKQLLEKALEFCRNSRYQQVDLWTVKGLHAAGKLYRSLGFSLEEEKEHHVWGALRTEQKYSLKL